jgi:hypothetical protein
MALVKAHVPKNSSQQENASSDTITSNENHKMIRLCEQGILEGIDTFAFS